MRALAAVASAFEWLLIALLAAMAMGLLAPAGAAQAVDAPHAMAALAVDVQRLTGRPIGATVSLAVWPDARIAELCRCRARALFLHGRVILSEGVDIAQPEGRAVLFHELVHALQWSEAGDAGDCNEWMRRESEAVAFERRWRLTQGLQLPPVPAYACLEPRER